jgi:NH3-dependent NAD+ synthetase
MDGFNLKDITNPTVIGTAHAVGRTVAGLMASNHFKTGIVATGNHTEIVEGWANFHDIGSIGVHAILGDLTKSELFLMSGFINNTQGKEFIPRELFDNSNENYIPPAAELPDSSVDPYDYWVTSGIDAELIRSRKSPSKIITDFENKTLTEDFFPNDFNGLSIYDRITIEDFKKCVNNSFKRSKLSVFKAAQGAPVVIISPRSRGFSNRETIINYWNG